MAYQPCILGTARLNNFRLAYYDQMFEAGIIVAGQQVRARVSGLTIRDVINDAPNTCSITFDGGGAVPQAEQALRITINARDPRLLFNGALQTVDSSYEGRPNNICYPCTAVDDTARATRRRPFGQWTTVSATSYALQLIQQFASGFSTAGVQAGLPPVSVILDGTEGMAGALAQGAQAIGGYYYFEDNTLYFFITPPPHDDPTPIDGSPGNLLDDPPISVSRDVSQLRTRQYGRAHGEALLADVGIGETIIPVANAAAWFAQAGSGLRAIAISQRLQYTGIQVGGNGSLVGPGAAPGNPPAVACVLGSGVNSGQHAYAYTFVTPSGETLPSPLGTVAVGLMSGPTSAPTPGTPSAGDGPDTGTHSYAATFLTASGETAVGPASAVVTTGDGTIPPPTSAPHPGTPTLGSTGPDPGSHVYATTFVSAYGETVPGPPSAAVVTGPITIPPPTNAPTPGTPTLGSTGPDPGSHVYATTFVGAYGETVPGPTSAAVVTGPIPIASPTTAPTPGTPIAGDGAPAFPHQYGVTFLTATGETTIGPLSTAVTTVDSGPVLPPATAPTLIEVPGSIDWGQGNTVKIGVTFVTAAGETTVGPLGSVVITRPAGQSQINVSNIPIGPPGTTARRLYRVTVVGGVTTSSSIFVVALADNSSTTITNLSAGSLYSSSGQVGPPSNTAGTTPYRTVPLTGIPLGPVGTTGRCIYRNISSSMRLLIYIGDNTTTTFLDNKTDAALGGGPPPTNAATAPAQIVAVTAIQTGPAGTTGRKLYRTTAGGAALKLLATFGDNSTTSFSDTIADAALGVAAPTVGGTSPGQVVAVTSIQTGPAGTTGRKLYRTIAGGATLKLVATFGDNSTTSFTDTVADAALGAAPPPVGATSPIHIVPVSAIPIGPSGTTGRNIYRTAANGSQLRFLVSINDNFTFQITDTTPDAGLGANAPTVGTAPANMVAITGIAVGAAPTTARYLYRTVAGGSQLRLITGLGDNATTAFNDTIADSALQGNAPTADTSGLAQPSGQVLAGSPSLIVASAATFPASGWALIGALVVVRYTGIAGNALTGIPATGPGSITTTVIWGTQVLPAPSLVGVTGITAPIVKGTLINLWVQRDDAAAQSDQATIDAANGVVPADGIYEGPVLVDERRNEASMRALCDATLIQFSRPIVTVRYACRDLQSKSGRTVRIDLANPAIHETLTIQEVTITEIDIAPHLAPRFTVTASTARFSLDDILRRLLLAADSATTLGRDATS